MKPIKHCYLSPMYLYSGYYIEGIGEIILDCDYLNFEINGQLNYDFLTSLN